MSLSDSPKTIAVERGELPLDHPSESGGVIGRRERLEPAAERSTGDGPVTHLHAVPALGGAARPGDGPARRTPDGAGLGPDRCGSIVGAAPAMRELYQMISRVAPTDATVLILGESGTGKELVAIRVHELSRRAARPMISINCGAIAPTLIESELFGHERGSFTGAHRAHRGHFERADGGTLFLDEINEMPYELQVRLLRVLESGTFSRVGGDRPIRVDVRILAAAKPDLELAAREGRFRSDLLYRLRVFPIDLPPLRERGGDLELLAEHFVAEMSRAAGRARIVTAEAMELLRSHGWPGNVRELKHTLQRAFILSDRLIGPELLGSLTRRCPDVASAVPAPAGGVVLQPGMTLAQAERILFAATLERAGGNRRKAAEMLQIGVKKLGARLRDDRLVSG